MTKDAPQPHTAADPQWVSSAVKAEPRLPLMGPYMAYLLLMMLTGLAPDVPLWNNIAIAAHIIAAGWAAWLMRRHWPPLGHPHLLLAIVVGVFSAWMWVAGQHWLEGINIQGWNLGGALAFDSQFPFFKLDPIDAAEISNIAEQYASPGAFWSHVILKITRAITIVPLVEELFWRGFILRALINWDRFEDIPIGQFGWIAFLGSSLLSVLQHPANWGVSILCWMIFNALLYWKKSLSCLILTHAVTNLVLYAYVVWAHFYRAGDWQFW